MDYAKEIIKIIHELVLILPYPKEKRRKFNTYYRYILAPTKLIFNLFVHKYKFFTRKLECSHFK